MFFFPPGNMSSQFLIDMVPRVASVKSSFLGPILSIKKNDTEEQGTIPQCREKDTALVQKDLKNNDPVKGIPKTLGQCFLDDINTQADLPDDALMSAILQLHFLQ